MSQQALSPERLTAHCASLGGSQVKESPSNMLLLTRAHLEFLRKEKKKITIVYLVGSLAKISSQELLFLLARSSVP